MLKISIILPLYNGETTIEQTLQSLLKQTLHFDELIIIDDGSSDQSIEHVKRILKNKTNHKILKHYKSLGLAASYNDGIKNSNGDLIVTIHQDVVLDNKALEKLVKPFMGNNGDIVATSHYVIHPLEIWKKYNFWQKCFFSRQLGKKQSGIDGKFDCFRKKTILDCGLFDENHFKTAGEDADMIYRLKQLGSIVQTEAEIVHLHKISKGFSWRDIIYKHSQYSEAQGVLLRRGTFKSTRVFFRTFFRESLILMLAIPYLRFVGAFFIILYMFTYTYKVSIIEYKNPKVLLLPFLNAYLLFISLYFTLKGFIIGVQRN